MICTRSLHFICCTIRMLHHSLYTHGFEADQVFHMHDALPIVLRKKTIILPIDYSNQIPQVLTPSWWLQRESAQPLI